MSSLLGTPPQEMVCDACESRLQWDKATGKFRAAGQTRSSSATGGVAGTKRLLDAPAKSAPASPSSRPEPPPASHGSPPPASREFVELPTTATPGRLSPPPGTSPTPGTKGTAPPSKDLIGKILGGCEILEWVGRGGMGSVYRARQVSLDRQVAFKVIGEAVERDEGLLKRFEREAKTIAKFNSSRIVHVYEVGFDQGVHFITMEFISGGDLKAKTKELGRLTLEEAIRYIRQATEGLLAAERQLIIHRDLKPENLMLDANGEIKITDFGLAKTLQTDFTLTQMGDYLGTPIYMSPEQAQGLTLDHRSDMYSLGATFCYLLTGNPPYTGDTIYEILRKKAEFEFLDPRKMLEGEDFPEPICDIIRRMTALQPKDRYPSFQDLLEDLDRFLQGRPVEPGGRRRRSRAPLAVVAVLLVAGGLLGGAYYGGLIPPIGGTPPIAGDPGKTNSGESTANPLPIHGDGTATQSGNGQDPPLKTGPTTHEMEIARKAESERLAGEALTRFENRLNLGGDDALHADVRRILADPVHKDLRATLRGKLERIEVESKLLSEAKDYVQASSGLKASAFPFVELPAQWKEIQERLKVPEGAGSSLATYLRDQLSKRERNLQDLHEVAASAGLMAAQERVSSFRNRGVETAGFLADIESLVEAKKRLGGVFPGAKDRWEKAIPEAEIASLRAEIAARQEIEREIETLRGALAQAEGSFNPIQEGSDFTPEVEKKLRGDIDRIEQQAMALAKKDPRAPLQEHQEAVQRLQKRVQGWTDHVASLRHAQESFGARKLGEAAARLDAMQISGLKDKDATSLGRARTELVAGFQALREPLDLDQAKARFSKAAELVRGTPAAAYPAACLQRLEELQAIVAGKMAVVRGGDVLVRKKDEHKVRGFFIDRYEVSVAEFRQFVRQMAAVKSFPEVANLWASESDFQRYRGEPEYFATDKPQDRWPVEHVNYHQANAFVRAHKKRLFTVEEWWLAAKGRLQDGHQQDAASFNVNRTKLPVGVGEGGEGRLFPNHSSVHHLSGNAAEWTQPGTGQKDAVLIGGRYLDSGESYFTGERLQILALHEVRQGCGFRGIIRPDEFFEGLLPVE